MTEATIETTEIETAIAPYVEQAERLPLAIQTVEEHSLALKFIGQLNNAEDRVKAFFKPMVEAAQEAKRKAEDSRKAVVGRQDEVLAPILAIRKQISDRAAIFERAEREAARLAQDAVNRAALERQEQEREFDAAMADTEDEAVDALTKPLPPPMVPTVAPVVAKVAGVSTRQTWGYEITDKAAFLAWAAKPENTFYATENTVALNARARAERDGMKIPGVKAVSKLTHARA